MVRKLALYGTGLIALYLGVYYYTGAGALIGASGNTGVGLIKAFQGR